MSINVLFANFSKRINSTAQPVESSMLSMSVVLKDGCTEHDPVFLISRPNNTFQYNYCKWDDRYYWVTNVEYTRNQLFTVTCRLDVLATHKAAILDTTAYVSYSSVSGGNWLPDTRLPVMKNCIVNAASANIPIFSDIGFYVLSVLGDNGCVSYLLGLHQLKALLDDITTWQATAYDNITGGEIFDSVENALQALSSILTKSDLLGNAFENIPSCIRSCIWIPFGNPDPDGGDRQKIKLGNFETGVTGYVIGSLPYTGSVSVSIPWRYSDWRRGYCEDVYLYLPLVGMIAIPSDSITNVSSLTVSYSYTMTDGTIAYQVMAGNEIIGTYGGSCAANYPIGINQQASAGQIMNSIVGGVDKMVSAGTEAGMNIAAGAVGAAVQGAASYYETLNVSYSTHPSVIGGVGGGAGAGLRKSAYCYTVAHSTVIEPSAMESTMGVPTMKPLKLSNCSGYCQCANASVAVSAHDDEIAEVNSYLNGGFYIE